MTADPKQLLAGPLRRAGVENADALVLEQLAALRGHHLLAEDGQPARRKPAAKTTERKLCGSGSCRAVELVNNTCPICGWTPPT